MLFEMLIDGGHAGGLVLDDELELYIISYDLSADCWNEERRSGADVELLIVCKELRPDDEVEL